MTGCVRVFCQGKGIKSRTWCSGVRGFCDLGVSHCLNQDGIQMLNELGEPTKDQP